MNAVLAELAAIFFKAMLQQILEHMPEIAAAWKAASTTTLIDAQVDPALTYALRKEQADAIENGTLPPAGVR